MPVLFSLKKPHLSLKILKLGRYIMTPSNNAVIIVSRDFTPHKQDISGTTHLPPLISPLIFSPTLQISSDHSPSNAALFEELLTVRDECYARVLPVLFSRFAILDTMRILLWIPRISKYVLSDIKPTLAIQISWLSTRLFPKDVRSNPKRKPPSLQLLGSTIPRSDHPGTWGTCGQITGLHSVSSTISPFHY